MWLPSSIKVVALPIILMHLKCLVFALYWMSEPMWKFLKPGSFVLQKVVFSVPSILTKKLLGR
jgi:hypothetical protein